MKSATCIAYALPRSIAAGQQQGALSARPRAAWPQRASTVSTLARARSARSRTPCPAPGGDLARRTRGKVRWHVSGRHAKRRARQARAERVADAVPRRSTPALHREGRYGWRHRRAAAARRHQVGFGVGNAESSMPCAAAAPSSTATSLPATCRLLVEQKTAGLPRACRTAQSEVVSKKYFSGAAILPKRVGDPTARPPQPPDQPVPRTAPLGWHRGAAFSVMARPRYRPHPC